MRLLNVKLLTRFRSLPAGSEFNFDNCELSSEKLEPICLVGLNGSWKSNLLECISEIFYYLETYVLENGKPESKFRKEFAFEISFVYNLSWDTSRKLRFDNLLILLQEEGDFIVTYKKSPNDIPKTTISTKKKTFITDSIDHERFFLPVHVIGYSSGQNELISNPFIKADYYYFDELENKRKKDIGVELPLNRLFFMDYDSSHIVAICNYLLTPGYQLNHLSKELKISDLDSFSIRIRYRNYRNNTIAFAQQIQSAISKLKSCATVYEETQGEANFQQLRLSFFVDEEMKRAFARSFGTAMLLYRDLYLLRLMNIHNFGRDTRSRIKKAGMDDNLSSLIPRPDSSRIIFQIEDIQFRKIGSDNPIKYKDMSDGEHQLMHVLGSFMLLNASGSILLFDEPETHFNPEWRSKLVYLINKVVEEIESDKKRRMRNQEMILTSHSPFIVSDCRKERVFMFSKGIGTNPGINTFGSSVDLILQEVFGISHSVSEYALNEIKRLLKKKNPASIIEGSKLLGESYEKGFLYERIEELKLKKKKKTKTK